MIGTGRHSSYGPLQPEFDPNGRLRPAEWTNGWGLRSEPYTIVVAADGAAARSRASSVRTSFGASSIPCDSSPADHVRDRPSLGVWSAAVDCGGIRGRRHEQFHYAGRQIQPSHTVGDRIGLPSGRAGARRRRVAGRPSAGTHGAGSTDPCRVPGGRRLASSVPSRRRDLARAVRRIPVGLRVARFGQMWTFFVLLADRGLLLDAFDVRRAQAFAERSIDATAPERAC